MKDLTENGQSFLPEGYKRPDNSKQFMKIEVGENKFRILSPALLGWIVFSSENVPFRKEFNDPFTKEELEEIKVKTFDDNNKSKPKHFWIMLVWCYKTDSIKVLEITQSSLMKQIETLLRDEDYGPDPSQYDIVITREGTGKNDTTYSVLPKPPKPISSKISKIVEEKISSANLGAIMEGEYPFSEYSFEN